MAIARLGAASTKAIRCGVKTTYYFDAYLKGFGFKVTPANARSWFIEYRLKDAGRRSSKKRLVIGSAATLTAEQARRAARDMLARVRLGGNPAGDQAESRRGVTLSELANAFLVEHVEAKRKGPTAKYYRSAFERLIEPKLGKAKAEKLTRAEIAKLHLANSATPYQANRLLAILGAMYTFGAKRGLVPEGCNPARGIERYKEEGRERFLTPDELQRLGDALREAETVGVPWQEDPTRPRSKHAPQLDESRRTVLGAHATGAIRLLLLTGCRLREILNLRWSEIDFDRSMLFLPDSKTGKKAVVLNEAAMRVLESLPRTGQFVIAGNVAHKPRADLNKPWRLVARRAGLSGVRLHDLRHSFASVGAGGGHGLPIIGKLLGHTQALTTQRYAHLDADPLRRASNTIGETIANALGEART